MYRYIKKKSFSFIFAFALMGSLLLSGATFQKHNDLTGTIVQFMAPSSLFEQELLDLTALTPREHQILNRLKTKCLKLLYQPEKFTKLLSKILIRHPARISGHLLGQLTLTSPEVTNRLLQSFLAFSELSEPKIIYQIFQPTTFDWLAFLLNHSPVNRYENIILKMMGNIFQQIQSDDFSFYSYNQEQLDIFRQTITAFLLNCSQSFNNKSFGEKIYNEILLPLFLSAKSETLVPILLQKVNPAYLAKAPMLSVLFKEIHQPVIKKLLIAGIWPLFAESKSSFKGKLLIEEFLKIDDSFQQSKFYQFLNQNSERIIDFFDFFESRQIVFSEKFKRDFFRKREVPLLDGLTDLKHVLTAQTDTSKRILNLLKILFSKDRDTKALRESFILLVHNLYFLTHSNLTFTQELPVLESFFYDYDTGKIGTGKLQKLLKTNIAKIGDQLIFNFILGDIPEEKKQLLIADIREFLTANPKIMRSFLIIKQIYLSLSEENNTTLRILKETLLTFLNHPDIAKDKTKFHRWLYQEAPWNKPIYQELTTQYGYDPLLWNQGLSKTFFADNTNSEKAQGLVKQIRALEVQTDLSLEQERLLQSAVKALDHLDKISQKVRIEIKFDFFDEAYCGVGEEGCLQPDGSYKEIPLLSALEANALFLRVYDEQTGNMVSRARLVLTPQGVVVFPTSKGGYISQDLYQPLFEMFLELLQRKWVPSIHFVSSHWYYKNPSAGFSYGYQNGYLRYVKDNAALIDNENWKKRDKRYALLSHRFGNAAKDKKLENWEDPAAHHSVKIEPWHIDGILKDQLDPRHYEMGFSETIQRADGTHEDVSVFPTDYTLQLFNNSGKSSAPSLADYQKIARDDLLAGIDFNKADNFEDAVFLIKRLQRQFADKITQLNKTDLSAVQQYKNDTFSYLGLFKSVLEQGIKPEQLLTDSALAKPFSIEFLDELNTCLQNRTSIMKINKSETVNELAELINVVSLFQKSA